MCEIWCTTLIDSMVVITSNFHCQVRLPGEANHKNNGGGRSQDYEQETSADSCRMRGIEGVGTVELLYFGRLLRMGGDSLLVPVWRSLGDGFTGKGESDTWLVRAGTWRPGNLYGSKMGYLSLLISCRWLMDFLPHHRVTRLDSIFIQTSHIHFYCFPLHSHLALVWFSLPELKRHSIFSPCS